MKNHVAKRRVARGPGVQWANHTRPSGSTASAASSIASRTAAVRAAAATIGGVERRRPARVVLGVDPTAGKHPGAARERELRVAPEHERLDPAGRVAEQDDGGGRNRRGQLVVGHATDPTVPPTNCSSPVCAPEEGLS